MIILSGKEYKEIYNKSPGKPPWYLRYFGIYPRGFYYDNEIYINKDAFFIDNRDYELVKSHEAGHAQGKEHTVFGVMSPYSVIRYITAW